MNRIICAAWFTGISQLQVYIILSEWDTYNTVTYHVENVKELITFLTCLYQFHFKKYRAKI